MDSVSWIRWQAIYWALLLKSVTKSITKAITKITTTRPVRWFLKRNHLMSSQCSILGGTATSAHGRSYHTSFLPWGSRITSLEHALDTRDPRLPSLVVSLLVVHLRLLEAPLVTFGFLIEALPPPFSRLFIAVGAHCQYLPLLWRRHNYLF